MVQAMLLGGLRRCEVLGLRLSDVQAGEKRRSSPTARAATSGWCRFHRVSSPVWPATWSWSGRRHASTEHVFVVLKGHSRTAVDRGRVDEVIAGARRRAGIEHLTCHQLRHTCFTRLREAGMALEAIQAQAGHRSIKCTRIYLHLANDWLAGEYRRAVEAIDAQAVQRLMPAPLSLAADGASVVGDYLAAMRAAGRKTGRSTTRAAHRCQARISRLGWGGMTGEQQVDVVSKARSFGSWLMVTGRIQVNAELLSPAICARASPPAVPPGRYSGSPACSPTTFPAWVTRHSGTCWRRSPRSPACPAHCQRRTLRRRRLSGDHAYRAVGKPPRAISWRGLSPFAADPVPRRPISTLRPPSADPPVAVTGWATAAPSSPRPPTVTLNRSHSACGRTPSNTSSRTFAGSARGWPLPTLRSLAAPTWGGNISRRSSYAAHPPHPCTGKPLNRVSLKDALINLHCFLARIADWGEPDAPARPLIFLGDLPIIDKPLPRFLDDAAAAKLQRVARGDSDPLSRLIVELLARTGIRRGEPLTLTSTPSCSPGPPTGCGCRSANFTTTATSATPAAEGTAGRLGQPPPTRGSY